MRTFYFNTGVKPYNTNVEMQIEAGNKFMNGELHMPFQVSDDVPENARLFCLSNNALELYGNDSNFIVTEVLGGNLHSKYAVFHSLPQEEPKQETNMSNITANQLIKDWKKTLESERIQLDNLDWARLVFNEEGEVVVKNEHGTQFPVSDLSDIELDIFYTNLI
jgi:hypothetical protein